MEFYGRPMGLYEAPREDQIMVLGMISARSTAQTAAAPSSHRPPRGAQPDAPDRFARWAGIEG